MVTEILSSSQAACARIGEVVRIYQADLTNGLSQLDATARQLYHGPNEFREQEQDSLLKKYLEQFKGVRCNFI